MRRDRGRIRGGTLGPSLLLASLVLLGFAEPAASTDSGSGAATVALRTEGRWTLVRYSTKGTVQQRFTGFAQISDFAVLDDSSVLVAEEGAGRLTAVSFDGRLLFETPVRQPRCLQVLGPDRFLVCRDGPAGVAEVDRSGRVLWELAYPLVDAAGALRLPDGNTAVVEGRSNSHAVRVFSPEGKLLWSGTDELAQPRGLTLLPSGEVGTSGFDTARIVFFQPYTNKHRTIQFCCHGDKPTSGRDGSVIIASNELQLVRSWDAAGQSTWQFSTFYPPTQGLALADGSVLVSEYRIPDRQCLNAAPAAQWAKAPLAPYWRSLLAGLGAATLLLVGVSVATRRRRTLSEPGTAASGAEADGPVPAPPLSGRRRLEIGLYCVGIAVLVAFAAQMHARALPTAAVPGWPYVGLVSAAGALLALLQVRLPRSAADWNERVRRSVPMTSSSWPVRLLWMLGAICMAFGLEGVLHKRGVWVPGVWIAGVVLLLGSALRDRAPASRPRPAWALLAAVLAALCGLRLYALDSLPANMHQDMAQWSLQALRLADGNVPTLFTNGWADIPLIGYVWSAVIDALGTGSVGAVRLPAAIGSALAIAATYLLARRLFGNATAVAAALFLGVDRVFLHFSRIEAYMDPVPFHVLAVLGLVAGLETGRRAWFALAGVAGGYAALTYHAGRITPPVLLLLVAVVLARHPRLIARRWSGLLLAAVTAAAMLGPQVMVFFGGWANAYGRSDQFVWARGEHIDVAALQQTIRFGLPRVFESFWLYSDSSTQYGGSVAFHPAVAALLGVAVAAAFLRLSDVRGLALVLWTSLILFIGGVLTVDPPFWPRLVTALVPALILAATPVGWLYRGASAAAGRIGKALVLAAGLVLVALDARYQFEAYRDYVLGTVPGSSTPMRRTEWVQSLMGRDMRNWQGALVYIVAANPIDHSCEHPTTQFYVRDLDVRDARDIADYLPFDRTRTNVVYFLPERMDAVSTVLKAEPHAEVKQFVDNVGRYVFTRVVARPAS